MAKKRPADSTKLDKKKQGQTARQTTKVPAFQEYDSPWKEVVSLILRNGFILISGLGNGSGKRILEACRETKGKQFRS